MKDLNRTFPSHPYFDKEQYGDIGQKALMNVLLAYSVYQEKVGYCQSMNFVVGFLLIMSGGNERDAFWMFCALTEKNPHFQPKMDGLRGVYKETFPLLQLYFH